MRFAKYHGCGNDFLVVDLRDGVDAAAWQDPANVRRVCDRQFGVGGDGVLAILPSETADVRMRVLNADGSEAEMCGNGIRCVAKYLRTSGEILVETLAGKLRCRLTDDGLVTVSMGAPHLLRREIPMTGPADERAIEAPFDVSPTGRMTAVSMGNPHAVTFVGSRDEAWRLANTIGSTVEHHATFPRRTNAEFAHVTSRSEIDLVVWERGCGITLACGTGACATVVAGILTDRVASPVRVNLPGGTLTIEVPADLSEVFMTGPAAHVFDGEIDLAALAARPQ